ncbi:MAG: tetratricopeptide repeat protein [Bdellovibrionales bacterium]
MKIYLIILILSLLAGCVTAPSRSMSALEGTQEELTREHRDQIFLTAQLYIFSENMEKAEEVLIQGVERSSGEDALEFRLMLSRVEGELGKVEDAYRRYVELANEFPENENVLKEVAQFLYSIRLKDDAYNLYSRLIKINPKESNYWIYRGLLALELADAKEAWDSFEFLIRKSKDAKHLGHLYMGKLMQMTGFQSKARTQFKKCLKVKAATKECALELARETYDVGEKKKAARILTKYLAKEKFRSNKELAEQLIDWHVRGGDTQEAISVVESMERVNPTDIKIKRKAAVLMAQNKDYERALERMKILVNYDEASEQDILNYTNLLKMQKNEGEAFRYISSVLNSDKIGEKTFFKKYDLEKKRVGFKKASRSLNKTCKKSIKKSDCLSVYSYVLWNDGDKLKAKKKLESIVRNKKITSRKMEYFLSQIYYEEGSEPRALRLIDSILLKDDRYAQALNFKAYHLITRELSVAQAEKLSLRAVSIEPRNGHYLDTYGYILFKKGDLKEAAAILREAVRLVPDEPEILEHLADVYVQTQNIKEAVRLYALASELYKGENQDRVGGKIAQIRSKNQKPKRSISSTFTSDEPASK